VRDGAVLPVFLNILGLLNLVQQNAPSNGASIEVEPRMCSGSEAGSYLRLIDFVYHSTLGLTHGRTKPGRSDQPRAAERSQQRRLH